VGVVRLVLQESFSERCDLPNVLFSEQLRPKACSGIGNFCRLNLRRVENIVLPQSSQGQIKDRTPSRTEESRTVK